MSDNREIAKATIETALKTIMTDRPGVHGSAENSFEMIGELWTVWVKHTARIRGEMIITGADVSQMMAMLKKARAIYGDATNADNFIDDVGYTGLAAMLQLPDPNGEITKYAGGKQKVVGDLPPKEPIAKDKPDNPTEIPVMKHKI